ncbi:MAG: hypothetical protein Q9195_004155 [Heterodermia aff. obscurata]
MDLKMPYISYQVLPVERPSPAPMNSITDPNQDSPQEIQEREELAAELEAMLDAAVEAEKEACIPDSDDEMGMDIDQAETTNSDRNLQEQHPQPSQRPANVMHSNSPPLLSAAPLKSDPAPRYRYLNRPKRVPVSPAQKIIAQQFLTQSRDHLRETSAGGHPGPGDEAANLNIRPGTARDIPEPAVTSTRNGTQYGQSDPHQMIAMPADDPGMHLLEMWRNLERPATVDERRTWYNNSGRRRRQQRSS